MNYYTPSDISKATGLTVRTVRTYLCERFPWHEPETWWRLDPHEFESVVDELKKAKLVSGCHPRRALRASGTRLITPRRTRVYLEIV